VTFQPHGTAQVKAGSTEKEVRFAYPHRGWSEFLSVFMPGKAQSWLVIDGTSLTNGVSKLYTADDDVIVLPRMIDDTGTAIAAYTKDKHTVPTEAQLLKANPELTYKTAGGVTHTPTIVNIEQLVPGKESAAGSGAGHDTAGGETQKSKPGDGKDQSGKSTARQTSKAPGAKPAAKASGAKPKTKPAAGKAKPSDSGKKSADKSKASDSTSAQSAGNDQAPPKEPGESKAEAAAFTAVRAHPETLLQKVQPDLIKPGAVICAFLPRHNYGVVFAVDSRGKTFTHDDKTALCVVDRDSSNHFDFPITTNPVFYHFPEQIVVCAKPLAAVRTVYSDII
ncbi:MAG: hypothetical protein ACRD3W_23100, partial [Terriglobales bacterium]